jgi:outer membrane protein assembly factor BamB
LPISGLRVAWQASIGALTDQAPVVDSRGNTYVVGTRGEVVTLGRDGAEVARVAAGGSLPSAPALLSDDTVAFVETLGVAVAVGVREGRVLWRTRFGRADPSPPAPLALDDGGVIVASSADIAALDAEGHELARATLPEAVAAPIVSALGAAVLVTVTGAVWTWAPGSEPIRIASFGSAIDGGAALADTHTLVAITAGRTHLTAVDLSRGTVTTRATSQGATWGGPPAMDGPVACVLAFGPASELVLALDATGQELARTVIGVHAPVLADAGVGAAVLSRPVTPPLVDASGTFVLATADGRLGAVPRVTSGDGPVELVATPCSPPAGGTGGKVAPFAGLAPLSGGAFVATCRSGTVLAVEGPRR